MHSPKKPRLCLKQQDSDMPSSSSGAGNPPNPLRIVLDHLSSSKSHRHLYNDTARGLHRASKDHQAAARATLQHLPLDKYLAGVVLTSLGSDPSNSPPAWPLDLLAAAPAVASWKVSQWQLASVPDLYEQLSAAAHNVRRLEVLDIRREVGVAGLGLLLRACTQLQKVHITFPDDAGDCPWQLLDPDSSSLSSAVCPPIPLTSWESSRLPYGVMEHWLAQQQQQPGGTLTRLVMRDCRGENAFTARLPAAGRVDIKGLAAVSGLRELQLDGISPSSLQALHSSSSSSTSANPLPHLTRLCAPGAALEAACGLTGLQHLTLKAGRIELCSSMSSMQQLTCLEIIGSSTRPVYGAIPELYTECTMPSDLGVWLPKLQRLEGFVEVQGALPASLTALTHLRLAGPSSTFRLPLGLTRLKELFLEDEYGRPHAVTGPLTGVPALEVLEGIRCCNLTALQPLTRLRRLSFLFGGRVNPATLTVLGHLQQLSSLDVACMDQHTSALTSIGPLPALQQLTIGLREQVDLGPWLVQCTALTKLCVRDNTTWQADAAEAIINLLPFAQHIEEEVAEPVDLGDLEYLPLQLQELQLQCWSKPQLPAGVVRLTALTALCVSVHKSGRYGPRELPSWLSQLRRLELLDISRTLVYTEQAVLAHMPALRRVKLQLRANPAKVFGSATHLCYGGCFLLRDACW